MDTWRFRIVIFMALAIFLFSDFLGYGNAKAEKHISRRASPTLREQKPNIFLDEGKYFVHVVVISHELTFFPRVFNIVKSECC